MIRNRALLILVCSVVIGFGALGLMVVVTDRHPRLQPVAAPDNTLLCQSYREWAAVSQQTVEGMENLCRER